MPSADVFLGLKRLRKRANFSLVWADKDPQGLKPNLYFVLLTARLKSCPDAYSLFRWVFPQPVKPGSFFIGLMAQLKLCPFTHLRPDGAY